MPASFSFGFFFFPLHFVEHASRIRNERVSYFNPKRRSFRVKSVRPASALLSLQKIKKKKKGGVWTLSCDFAHPVNETLKMAHTAAHLNAESVWW